MTHTPGPWHRNIKPARKYGVIFAGRNTHVARLAVEGLADDEIEANCDLITAAPDMLAALVGLVGNGFTDEELARRWSWSIDAIREARAAITKAEGRG